MGILKSQEEFYLRLHMQLIRCDPLEAYSSVADSLKRDLLTLQSRVTNEGLAFMTKLLPRLGRELDHALVSGSFKIPNGFKQSAKNPSIPAFLQAYFKLVFDENGFLLDTASPEAVKHLRQVLFFAYKLEIPFSADDEARVIESFIATDKNLRLSTSPLASSLMLLAKTITRKVFDGFNHKDIQPRHGPGAVATGEKLDAKWNFSRLYSAIHQVYPYYDYYIVGGARELTDRLDWYRSLRRCVSGCAKVVLVPKDSRGPRLISCEPLEYQWIQQGLGRKLANFLEYDSSYTRGRINFTDQEINRKLAKASSSSGSHATIDLKDASDRVSLDLVRGVFHNTPELLRGLEACRTTETLLPDGEKLTLKKFAPMGSALCFPVESYIFWVVMVSAVIYDKLLPLEKVGSRIFVYGDDIIVPTKWAPVCIQALEEFGLMVNLDKSCITGFFRESCGLDAFKGFVVTPIRLRKQWTNQHSDGTAFAAYTSLANNLSKNGYDSVSDLIWSALEDLYGKIPYGTFRASYPCKIVRDPSRAVLLNMEQHRWKRNSNYQRTEFLVHVLKPRYRKTRLGGWHRLLRDIVSPPVGDPSLTVLPFSVKVKKGWVSVA